LGYTLKWSSPVATPEVMAVTPKRSKAMSSPVLAAATRWIGERKSVGELNLTA
jgi:hypothetical protein